MEWLDLRRWLTPRIIKPLNIDNSDDSGGVLVTGSSVDGSLETQWSGSGAVGQVLGSDGTDAVWHNPCPYYAGMYLSAGDAATHSNSGNFQKVGGGADAGTWVALCDIRPSGVSAQVDTATNKRIDIRQTGIYAVTWSVCFAATTTGQLTAGSVYVDGVEAYRAGAPNAALTGNTLYHRGSVMVSLTSGNYLELFGYQVSGGAKSYGLGSGVTFLSVQYLGAAS